MSIFKGGKRWRWAIWLQLSILISACAPGDHAPMVGVGEVLFHAGDSADGAAIDLDDSGWEPVQLAELSGQPSLFWMRTRITLNERHARGDEPLAVWFSAMATCTLFWDGNPLPGKGSPGVDRASERPGPVDVLAYLPTSAATQGSHVLAARCSTHHRGFEPMQGFYGWGVGAYLPMAEGALGYVWTGMASLTGMVVAAVYFLAMFLARRRYTPALCLVFLSLSAVGLLVAEAWRVLVGYTYDWHLTRLLVVLFFAWCCGAALVLYFLLRFPAPGRRKVGASFVSASVALIWFAPGMDAKVLVVLSLALVMSFAWGFRAARRRVARSRLVTVGVGLCLLVLALSPMRFGDLWVFFALDALLVFLLVEQVLEARRERDQLDSERLRATRLELELVKKSIQPHFLMNTLTALAEWFERKPEVAGKAIDAIAQEIRLLGDLAAHKQVPFEAELDLCRAHLEVMGFRRGGAYRLKVSGVKPEAPCPPGILHTRVENAVTHGPAFEDGEIVLNLEGSEQPGMHTYRLSSPLADDPAIQPATDGTGLRYIKTRLQEAFGERYRFAAGVRDGKWVNEWSVPASIHATGELP